VLAACHAALAPPHAGGTAPVADDDDDQAVADAPLRPSEAAGGAADEDSIEQTSDELDDSGEGAEPPSGSAEPASVLPHPLDGWSDAQVAHAVTHDLHSLGPMSVGSPNAGALINGVQASENALYKPVSPNGTWATQETLDFLAAALTRVHEQFPDTPPLALGDISNKNGGLSRPHVSHQSGRDVDIAYFYVNGASWYARATAKNLDLPRTWSFVRALLTETDIDLILIDHSIQVLLEDYAKAHGEDPTWLASVFRGVPGKLRPLIRHAPGHATHIHIRFFNPIAQETGRRCHQFLLQAKLTRAPQSFISHKVKKNETLGMLSRKYGVSVPRLRAVNGLKSSLIREKSVLRIPVASRGTAGPGPRLRLPARRLPPPVAPPVAADPGVAQPPPTK
jgi:penicillin-insensitive murein endopeptidase